MVVASDSVAALTMVVHCQIRGVGTSLVAREVALDLAEGVYRPDVAAHVPGVTNVLPDALSRLWEPGAKSRCPEGLRHVQRAQVPPRPRTWWRTLDGAPR